MSIKTLFFICCASAAVYVATAKEPDNKDKEIQNTATQLMDERVSELMADRVGFKKDIALQELAAIDYDNTISYEALMYPADELYGSHWDNRFVNPFQGAMVNAVTFPDTYEIDCSSFVIPIDREIKVTSKYGPRRRRMHRGIDLKVYVGDTIRTAFDGKVRIKNYERGGYGYYLVLRHPNGLETVYGHLSKFLVTENDIVRAGEPIGLGGNTGRSTGLHLHFETRFLGKDIDPAHIIDFENGVPHQDKYVFRNVKSNGRSTNVYTAGNGQMEYHRVRSGDTLGKIARMYGTTVNELCRLNGIKSTTILRVGQSLRCSEGGGTATATKATTTQSTANKTIKVETNASEVASHQQNTSSDSEQTPVYHKIKEGDTLGAIAKKYGTTVSKLCELNGISKNTILRLGRSIRCS